MSRLKELLRARRWGGAGWVREEGRGPVHWGLSVKTGALLLVFILRPVGSG